MKQNIIIGGYQGSDSLHTKSVEHFIDEISNDFIVDFEMDVTENGEKASSLISKALTGGLPLPQLNFNEGGFINKKERANAGQ